jgi:SAM-dependent MidA family methyltransferase
MTPEAEIRHRIREHGPITFAQFMDLALYWQSKAIAPEDLGD